MAQAAMSSSARLGGSISDVSSDAGNEILRKCVGLLEWTRWWVIRRRILRMVARLIVDFADEIERQPSIHSSARAGLARRPKNHEYPR
jgi:hypothetical protein